jgi:hypothetical protein
MVGSNSAATLLDPVSHADFAQNTGLAATQSLVLVFRPTTHYAHADGDQDDHSSDCVCDGGFFAVRPQDTREYKKGQAHQQNLPLTPTPRLSVLDNACTASRNRAVAWLSVRECPWRSIAPVRSEAALQDEPKSADELTTEMDLGNALSIAIPALAVVAVLTIPGKLRMTRRPPGPEGPPDRRYAAGLFALLLAVAIIHVIT